MIHIHISRNILTYFNYFLEEGGYNYFILLKSDFASEESLAEICLLFQTMVFTTVSTHCHCWKFLGSLQSAHRIYQGQKPSAGARREPA